jgi:hypothetical protein
MFPRVPQQIPGFRVRVRPTRERFRVRGPRNQVSFARGLLVPTFLVLASLANGPAFGDQLATKLKQQVNEILAGRRPLAEVELNVIGGRPDRGHLTVYGSGVGIWNREKQFALTPDEHKELLKRLVTSGLFEMPERPRPAKETEPSPDAPAILRSVGVRIGDLERVVAQTDRVWTLPALEALVADLFKLCEKPASKGTGASTLTEGLEKVAEGKLAPETLLVVLNLPPVAAGKSSKAANGFVAALEGGALTWSEQVPGEPAVTVRSALSAERIRSLAALLARSGLEKLPVNLYRERYVDLTSTVLGRVKTLQARNFAGLKPGKHPAQQEALETIIEAVLALGPPPSQGLPPGASAAGKPEGALR